MFRRNVGLFSWVFLVVGCSDPADSMDVETEMEPEGPPPIPASCQGVPLDADRGQATRVGHFTTAAVFDAASIADWRGTTPEPEHAVLVLASDYDYDCNHLVSDRDLDYSQTFSSQLVFVFAGPLEIGELRVPDDVDAYQAMQLGDGMGNAGFSEGDAPPGTLTIQSIAAECVTGLWAEEGYDGRGFAVTDRAACN